MHTNVFFFLFNLIHFFSLSVRAAPSPTKETTRDIWTVLIRHGNLTFYEESIKMAKESESLQFRKEIKDDNSETFNAFIVAGNETTVRSMFNKSDYIVSRHTKLQALGNGGSEKYNWGLRRISRNPDKYLYPESAGENVVVYVVDTGIDYDHELFGGRVVTGKTFGRNTNPNGKDADGHGTHVAGIIGSQDYGVAPKAKIINLALSIESSFFEEGVVLEALQWILSDVKKHKKKAIVNLSLGGPGTDEARQYPLEELYNSGVHVVTAAGNSAIDACSFFPGASPFVLNVAASSAEDQIAEFSNFGECVGIVAPGTDILSLQPENQVGVASGTSMAAPFVTGVLALLLSEKQFPSVKEAFDYVKEIAVDNELKSDLRGTPNLMLFNGISSNCNDDHCELD